MGSYGRKLVEMFALIALVAALHLTAKDNNHLFKVNPQRSIVVTLASNPSTGYHWKYSHGPDQAEGGRKVVTLISHRYVAPKSAKPGAAGKEIWRLRATAQGEVDLRFRYIRAAAPNKPAKKIRFTIDVG